MSARRRDVSFALVLGLLILAQVAWFLWYLTVPLPNAQAVQTTLPDGQQRSEPLRRWYLIAQALPHIVPGTTWKDSLLGTAVHNLSHVENLGDRLPIVGAGLLILAAGLGLGTLLLWSARLEEELTPLEKLGASFGLGLTVLSALTLVAGRLGLLDQVVVWIVLMVLTAAGIARVIGRPRRVPRPYEDSGTRIAMRHVLVFMVCAAPFLLLMVLGSLQPSLDFDALEYHLQGPKEWFQAGRISFLPHNVYTAMPFSVEMLHLLGMYTLGDWWTGAIAGQFLVMLHAPFATLMLALLAHRLAGPRAALVAALVYLGTPWVYRLSVFAYVEGPLGYYHAALIWAFWRVWNGSQAGADAGTHAPGVLSPPWFLVGMLAGGAMACKYTALISAVIPAGVVLLAWSARRRTLSGLLPFAIGLGLSVGPWLVKNQLDHGNPVYPLANRLFHGSPWSPEREQKWQNAHGPRAIGGAELLRDASDVAGRNDWQSPLYVALAPLAFVQRETRRWAGWLGLNAVYLFATWWLLTHRLDRFWLPILPTLAVLAGLGASWTWQRAWTFWLVTITGLGLFCNWFYDTTALAALNRWTDRLETLRQEVPRLASPSLTWLDEHLPDDAKVLLVGPAGVFHMKHPIVYNTVFDDEILERLAGERTHQDVLRELADRSITHVWVDWSEIARYRSPGNYGFTDFVTPALFQSLVDSQVLDPLPCPIPNRSLYRVRLPDPHQT